MRNPVKTVTAVAMLVVTLGSRSWAAQDSERSVTYRLLETVRAQRTPNGKPVVYLVGETHLGTSQKEVARILVDLMRKHEIDAVFLEQPDNLTYDWSKYSRLEANPSGAIANLQREMLADAGAPTEMKLGKFDKYLKMPLKTDQDKMALQQAIVRDHGMSGLQEFARMLEIQSPAVGKAQKKYDASETVSAADYLYIMLHLQGIQTPFHNVELLSLREAYKKIEPPPASDHAATDATLKPRDEYMSGRIAELVGQHGYRRSVLVCGALHIRNQMRLLAAAGFEPRVAYQSAVDERIKREMSTLVKPNIVVDIATRPTEDRPAAEYVVENAPSAEISAVMDKFFKSGEDERVRRHLLSSYSASGARAQPEWTLVEPSAGGRIVALSKIAGPSGSIEMTALRPLEAGAAAHIEALQTPRHFVLMYSDDDGHYRLADAGGTIHFEGASLSGVLAQIDAGLKRDATRTVFVELKGFSEDEVEAFATSCRLREAKEQAGIRVKPLVRSPGSAKIEDLFFQRDIGLRLDGPPAITEVTEGPRKGWVQVILGFTTKVGRFALTICARTAEAANQLVAMAKLVLSGPTFQSASVAELVTEVRWQMRKQHGVSESDIVASFADELGTIHIVEAPPPRARLGARGTVWWVAGRA